MRQFWAYIRYFIYLGINWNWRIAATLIVEEIKGEKKYGIQTTGADELKSLEKAGINISHATIYMPVSYGLLEKAFRQTGIGEHFLDIGCGKGRAMCVAATAGFKRVTGIDFSPSLCNEAEKNIRLTQSHTRNFNYQIICTDATGYSIPKSVDCIFLFNPFDQQQMYQVVQQITKSLNESPRPLQIIYANPLYKSIFLQAGFVETHYSIQMKYLEYAILKNGKQ